MMLKEAFKVGFLKRLAEYGIAPSELEMGMQLTKCAEDSAIGGLMSAVPIVALAVPAIAGMLTGKMHSDFTSEPDDAPKRLMQAQRLNAIREQSERLRYQISKLKNKRDMSAGGAI